MGARLTHSPLRRRVRRRPVSVNGRLQARGFPDINRDFADFFIRAGNGQIRETAGEEVIELPTNLRSDATNASSLEVAREVFPSINADGGRCQENYCSHAALCSKNHHAGTMNEAASSVSPRTEHALHNADPAEVGAGEGNPAYPVEFFNSLNAPVPPCTP